MFLDLRAVSNIKNLVENMKNEINLTKTEKKLEYFLIIIGIVFLIQSKRWFPKTIVKP